IGGVSFCAWSGNGRRMDRRGRAHRGNLEAGTPGQGAGHDAISVCDWRSDCRPCGTAGAAEFRLARGLPGGRPARAPSLLDPIERTGTNAVERAQVDWHAAAAPPAPALRQSFAYRTAGNNDEY